MRQKTQTTSTTTTISGVLAGVALAAAARKASSVLKIAANSRARKPATVDESHGPLCEMSKGFIEDGNIIACLRFTRENFQKLINPEGWKVDVSKLGLEIRRDGTLEMNITPATKVDLLSNHQFQRVLLASYDLLRAVNSENGMPDAVILAASEMETRLEEAQRS